MSVNRLTARPPTDRVLAADLSHIWFHDGSSLSFCRHCGWQQVWSDAVTREQFWAAHARAHVRRQGGLFEEGA